MINKQKKILFIGKRSYNNLGSYDYEYLKRLNESKLNFHISIFYACSTLYDQKKLKEIKYLKIFKYNNLSLIKKSFSYVFSLLKLLKFINKNQPDVIHLQWLLFPFVDNIWLKLIRLTGWKGLIIITIHNAKTRKGSITDYLFRACYKKIDHFIVHSSKCKEYLLSKYKFLNSNSIFVGRHGLINLNKDKNFKINEFKIYSKICNLRKKYKNLYIFIGNLSKYKGFDLLIDAWINYKKKSKDKKNSALIVLGKSEKFTKKFLSKYRLYDKSLILHDSFISDKLLDLAVNKSNYILLLHRYISHSGIHSSLLKKSKLFIYNNNKYNHMTSHKYFIKTGIGFENNILGLSNLFLKIEKEKIKNKRKDENWKAAMDYFSWEKSFPDKLLNKIYGQ